MDDAQIKRIIEALLFVFGEPLALKRLSEVLDNTPVPKVRELVQALNEEYVASGRAFQIQEVAGGFQLVTDVALASWIRKALASPKPDSVSKGALETLAIIAYRQPITKAEAEAIRGVDVSAALDTLVERNFVRVTGRKESAGRPFLYGTTSEFLRHFGLKSLEALPPMEHPILSEPSIESAESPAGAVGDSHAEPAEGTKPESVSLAISDAPSSPQS